MRVIEMDAASFAELHDSLVSRFYKPGLAKDYYCSGSGRGLSMVSRSADRKAFFGLENASGEPSGCIALFEDSRLEKGSGVFGFLECISSFEAFLLMWNAAVSKAKGWGINLLRGPVNGSIWHPYRVTSQSWGNEYFPSEPLSQEWYHDYLARCSPSREVEYHSAAREKYDYLIQHTARAIPAVKAAGIKIEVVESPGLELMQVLHGLSSRVFTSSWCYVPLDTREFLELYTSSTVKSQVGSLYLAREKEQVMGFCMNIGWGDTLIMKTIAVEPGYQQLGIGNALVHQVHADARDQGFSRVLYALVNKENKIQHFPREELVPWREYKAFEYSI